MATTVPLQRLWLRFAAAVIFVAAAVHATLILFGPTWHVTLMAGVVWVVTLLFGVYEFRKNTAQSARELEIWLKIGLDLILTASPDEVILQASGGWVKAAGYTPSDLIGRRWSEFLHPEDALPAKAVAEQVLDGTHITQYANRWRHKQTHPDGTPQWVWLEWSAIEAEGVIFATARPLASRLEHESLMAMWSRVSADLMGVVEARPTVQERRFEWVNEAWTRVLGWTTAEMYEHPTIWFIHPDDIPIIQSRHEARQRGETVDVGVSLRLKVKTPENQPPQYRWFDWKSVVIDGRLYSSGRDITDERQNQERMSRAIDDLEESNDDLERFASVAAHQLRSPPRTILGVAQALEDDYGNLLDSAGRLFLQDIRENAEQMSEIVNGLYRFSKVRTIEEMAPKPVDLNVVLNTIRDIKAKRGCFTEGNRKLTVDLLPTVLGDTVLIQEVLANLIDNGFKFNKSPVGIVHVSASHRPDGRWDIHVADNGIGVDAKYHKKLFQMFQRVHPTYQGTGVGLALVKSIVHKFGGEVSLVSEVGKGSTFTFDLPGLPS